VASARLFTPLTWDGQRFDKMVLEVCRFDGTSERIVLRAVEKIVLDMTSGENGDGK